ncbi:unnamed protein product [Cunninghamella blakesleeana]
MLYNIIATTETDTMEHPLSWLSWLLIKIHHVISTMIRISQLPMLPFLWMTQWLFQQLVITPYHMAVETTHILYPILIYCAAACFCGAIIGFCSGFATEAIITMFINATWGKEVAKKYRDKKRNKNKNSSSRENETPSSSKRIVKEEDEEDENDNETFSLLSSSSLKKEEINDHEWNQPTIQSPTSSFYRFSISSDTSSIQPIPTSFYDDKPDHWYGNDDDPEEIASFLRQRRKLHQHQQ